ncbi:hypothetical protein C3F09_05120 [candidate division GN15 bacterium]|uniref:Carboxymuconolactone decarboxylase family protein n=1 Tax=candidate division GN15 bacterium TaxID=2072418 RepID=A0A855X4F1_9BACT|nr:MAG: hypothetical protein C3F09_05120 [candidate division GN15 bacterium]
MAALTSQPFAVPRAIALYAASIATGDDDTMIAALALGRKHALDRDALYEVVLQSYLFLGFPRMLLAADVLNRELPAMSRRDALPSVGGDDFDRYMNIGEVLCREIYGTAYEPLRARIESMAPEVFRWMIVEGYGKVMSRPGLGKVEREIASVGFHLMEGYEQPLFSHIRGALNVGAPAALVAAVIDDIGPASGDGGETARRIFQKVGAR